MKLDHGLLNRTSNYDRGEYVMNRVRKKYVFGLITKQVYLIG